MRRTIRHRTLALTPLVGALWLSAAAIAEPASGGAATDERCPVIHQADALLERSASASEAAIHWLEANVSPAAVSMAAESAQDAAQRRWDLLVADARRRCTNDRGTFVYTPGVGQSPCGNWTGVGNVEALPTNVVVLVHGLDEPGDIWDDLAPALSDAGHAVVRFNYPNDQDPALSADALWEALRLLRRERDVERIDLVCHSMGGLVARDVMTRGSMYACDGAGCDGENPAPAVEHLITIGTPNQGSVFAPLRAIGEVREHFARWLDADGHDPHALLGFMHDGDGAAADALTPGSPYLKDLNQRGLPRHTAMTIIVGKASPAEAEHLGGLLDSGFAKRMLGSERIERLRRQTTEVVGAVGDGVVTVESARLEGVDDTVILEANHRSLVRHIPVMDRAKALFGAEPTDPPAIGVVLDRLDDADPDAE